MIYSIFYNGDKIIIFSFNFRFRVERAIDFTLIYISSVKAFGFFFFKTSFTHKNVLATLKYNTTLKS